MGYRVFRDSQGMEWQTWDVVPHLADRRLAERRRAAIAAAVEAERRRTDRRVNAAGRRPVLNTELGGGWLCFEAPTEKRRLIPIPADWMGCDEQSLERYLRDAKPAARHPAAVDISAFGDSGH